MYCPKCGTWHEDTFVGFCNQCGESIGNKPTLKNSSKNKNIIIAFIVSLVVICFSAVAILIGLYSKNYELGGQSKKTSAGTKNKSGEKDKAIINLTQVNADLFPKIRVYFSVNNNKGEEIKDLGEKKFKLREKNKASEFSERNLVSSLQLISGKEALNISLVMDKSSSMSGSKIEKAKDAATKFLKKVDYDSGDMAQIISFNDYVSVNQEYTSDFNSLNSAIRNINVYGDTALYDSLYMSLLEFNKREGHKCIMAFTDGQDNRSRYTKEQVIQLSNELSIPIYIMGIGSDVEEQALSIISEKTKGNYYRVDNVEDMEKIYGDIFRIQKGQYVLTYESNNDLTEDWRDIELSLEDDNYTGSSNYSYTPKKMVDKKSLNILDKDLRSMLSNEKGIYSIAYESLKDDLKLDINSKPTKAASTIKLFVMMEAFNEIRQGKLRENEILVLRDYMKVAGTGSICGCKDGTEFTVSKLIELMISDSDNTAANMLIDRLGMDNINRYITNLGCKDTVLKRKMMDFDSVNRGIDNITSTSDMCLALYKIYRNQAVGEAYDRKMMDFLKNQKNNTKIPKRLPSDVVVAHKTGEYPNVENDVALIFSPKGDYILCILTDGTPNDIAIENDGKISERVYNFNINRK